MKDNKCPRCSGKMYIETASEEEEYCINCGHVEYMTEILDSELAIYSLVQS